MVKILILAHYSQVSFGIHIFWGFRSMTMLHTLGNIWPNSYQRDALVWQSMIISTLLNQSVHIVTVRSNVSLLTELLCLLHVMVNVR